MVVTQATTVLREDLAGIVCVDLTHAQLHQRIKYLINRYLSTEYLGDRLADLPHQFEHPQPRPWKPLDWHSINPSQIVGMDRSVFRTLLVGALDTEAPIRGYTQTSRQYLEQLHPSMATFVGGVVDQNNVVVEPGLWEKEERQHTPALVRLHIHLTGEKATPTVRTVRGYCPTSNPQADLYRHGVHRIATEYGATCLYLWMMAHSTGALQAVLEELLIDEINHMTKFWGFGTWAYPDARWWTTGMLILHTTHHRTDPHNSLARTLKRMATVLKWSDWSTTNRLSFSTTCLMVLHRMWTWNRGLSPEFLNTLIGDLRYELV